MQKFRFKSIASLSIITLLNSVLSFSAFANDSKEGVPALSNEYCITDISLIAHGDTHNVYGYTPDMVHRTKTQTNFVVGTWNSPMVDVRAAGGERLQGNADFSYKIAKIGESLDSNKPESLCYEDTLLVPNGSHTAASIDKWDRYGYWYTPWAFNPEINLEGGKTGMTMFVKKITKDSTKVLTKLTISQGNKNSSGWHYNKACDASSTTNKKTGFTTTKSCLGGWAQGNNENYGFRLEKEAFTDLKVGNITVGNAKGEWKAILDCAGSPCIMNRKVTTGITKGKKFTKSRKNQKVIKNAFQASLGTTIMGVTASASYSYSDERTSQISNSAEKAINTTKEVTSTLTCNSTNLYQWVLKGKIKCHWTDMSCLTPSNDTDFEAKTESYVCTPEKITVAESTNPLWAGCKTKEVTNPTNIGEITYANPSNKASTQTRLVIPVTTVCDNIKRENKNSTLRFAMLDQQLSFWEVKNHKLQKWDFRNDIPDSSMWALAAIGDLNNDGENDMLWFNKHSSQFEYWIMKFGKRISGGIFSPKITKNMKVIGIADINNDGHNNIILTDNKAHIFYWNINHLKIESIKHINHIIPTDWSPIGVGDMTQSGNVEIIFYNKHKAIINIWKLNSGNVENNKPMINLDFTELESEKWKPNGITDINQDGISDIIFSNGTEFKFLIIDSNKTALPRKVNFNLPENSNLVALVATK